MSSFAIGNIKFFEHIESYVLTSTVLWLEDFIQQFDSIEVGDFHLNRISSVIEYGWFTSSKSNVLICYIAYLN